MGGFRPTSAGQEKRSIADNVQTSQEIASQTHLGWNSYWMRSSIHILKALRGLGFIDHIDEPSRDEPFIVPVRGRDFVIVPYTIHMNDVVSYPFQWWHLARHEQAFRDEFGNHLEEHATRRRMMVIGLRLNDRISGQTSRLRGLNRFLTYAKIKPGVWFARKDEIARYALTNRPDIPVFARGPPR
jgi:hypothetical protein